MRKQTISEQLNENIQIVTNTVKVTDRIRDRKYQVCCFREVGQGRPLQEQIIQADAGGGAGGVMSRREAEHPGGGKAFGD